MAIAVGSAVRFNVAAMRERFPRITPEFNLNSPMTVVAVVPQGIILQRQGKVIVPVQGPFFRLAELIEVATPVANPPAPLVPDAIP